MIEITIDAEVVVKKLAKLEEQLSDLKTRDMPDEMTRWQEEEFNRKKPNMETNATATSATVSTKFWGRPVGTRMVGRAGRRITGRRYILRPEVIVDLGIRMKRIAREAIQWP
jgi:hypothetical protein